MADIFKKSHSFLALVLGGVIEFFSLFSGFNWTELNKGYKDGFWRSSVW